MIRSCHELVDRIFAVAHCTVALIDTKSGQFLSFYPANLLPNLQNFLRQRASVLTGRIGELKPLMHLMDMALLGVDSSKVLVVAPPFDKNGRWVSFTRSELNYLNLILELYASTISYDFVGVYQREQQQDQALNQDQALGQEQSSAQEPAPMQGLQDSAAQGQEQDSDSEQSLSHNASMAASPSATDTVTQSSDNTVSAGAAGDSGAVGTAGTAGAVDSAQWQQESEALAVVKHNPYRIEQAIKEAVRLGDERLLQYAFAIPVTGHEGKLALDELRSLKNHANLVNVLCSRAAIDGGVSYEEAFRLSDKLFLAVEALTTPEKAFAIRYNIALAFTQQVHQHLQQAVTNKLHRQVEEAILYIRQHIYDHITVTEVADAVSCHRNYLQRLFRQDTAFSVVDFIHNEKLKVVKELLAYSNESVSNIAELLNFASPSHLCQLFKEQEHMTPLQYRQRHRALV